MLTFFKTYAKDKDGHKNKHYLDESDRFKKMENEMKELEPFQLFMLTDLLGLLNFRKIYYANKKVQQGIASNLRNAIMHAKDVVRHKDFESDTLIYDFKSFKNFSESVEMLRKEIENVKKKDTNKPKEEEYVTGLRKAGLFMKLSGEAPFLT